MITVTLIFLGAVIISWLMTPYMAGLGRRLGAMDLPDARKVHTGAVSRLGGVAIFLSFHVILGLIIYLSHENKAFQIHDEKVFFAFFGGVIIFGIGLIDDIMRLGYRIKFVGQIAAATIAFYGGVQIQHIGPFGFDLEFGWFSYAVTVFWFLLFINSINLADGLDGLAGGVVFFAAFIMMVLLTVHGDFGTAMIFAALGGAVLGFLRYNFNPAIIFMGDSGSYFLGYTLAATTILCSVKSELSALLLIPLVCLGVPIFDTILSPIRRFVAGRGLFSPDKSHIHHRLLEMGLSTPKVVILIYGLSLLLGLMAIGMVSFRSELRGFFLVLLAAGIFIFIRKLRYFEYFTAEKMYGWLIDVTDTSGFSQERRSFLNIQMDIVKSRGFEELWENVKRAVEVIHFDMAEFNVKRNGECLHRWVWVRNPDEKTKIGDNVLEIHLPLIEGLQEYTGTLMIAKDIERRPLHSYTLRRVEHLRRAIKEKFRKIGKEWEEVEIRGECREPVLTECLKIKGAGMRKGESSRIQ